VNEFTSGKRSANVFVIAAVNVVFP
jgi:hypothetical protein